MSKLEQRYDFDWYRVQFYDSYHIEYCITDICNRNCVSCSHLAPLAKTPNYVTEEEFLRVVGIMRRVVPDAHTFWLTGGEPTLHPKFISLLKALREIYYDSYVGIYTNGMTLNRYENDSRFWNFVRNNGIVWAVTGYDRDKRYFDDMFWRHDCYNNLAYLHDGKIFFRLTDYSQNQSVSSEKYDHCGWERSKINIRNGKIYNCPSCEFADLFADYFGINLAVDERDYLTVDNNLTRERLESFRGPVPFCSQCDIRSRHKEMIGNKPSEKDIGEWSELYKTIKGDNHGKY